LLRVRITSPPEDPMKAALTAAACLAVLAACSPQEPASAPEAQAAPEAIASYALPAEISYPEGVAFDPAAGVLYTANAEDGTVVRLDPRTGQAAVLTKAGALFAKTDASFPSALGVKFDGAGKLWIAGGRSGRIFVVNAADGSVFANLETKAPGAGLINDGALTAGGAFFTDSLRPVLWRVDTSGSTPGQPEAWLDLSKGPIQYGDGPNLNGIVATPDGKSLIVVQMNKGLLFHIDVATKAIEAIDLKGESLSGADGLLLDGDTLYVVRQTEGEIATVALAGDLKSGEVKARMRDAALAWPATAAKDGDRLLVVNTQFNARDAGTAKRPFAILGVPLSRLNP
jgi:Cu-Zn family superoxide dismutase